MTLGLHFLVEHYETPDKADAEHWLRCRAHMWDWAGGRRYQYPLRLKKELPIKGWRATALYLDSGTNRAGRSTGFVEAREFPSYGLVWGQPVYAVKGVCV